LVIDAPVKKAFYHVEDPAHFTLTSGYARPGRIAVIGRKRSIMTSAKHTHSIYGSASPIPTSSVLSPALPGKGLKARGAPAARR
jgi:hypothetical protein